jgi:L-alanine-DL-glutamate epimerase-like enolase superfamily enzyme
MGIGAIEGAMLDARAKAAGLPVHRLLGALRDRVPAYYSGGLWNTVLPDELQKTARTIVEHGYKAMKLRVGTGKIRDQVERVKAVREAIGGDVRLMVDAGQRLNVRDAIRLGREIEEFQLEWLEEPVASHDHEGERRVAAELDVPIASGENIHSSLEFREMINGRCVDVLMPDQQRVGGPRVGGPRQFLQIAHMAAAAGIPVSSHLAPEMSLGLLATLPNAIFVEVMPWSYPLYAEHVEVVDGFAVAPERPGWGYSLDQSALRRFAVT